MKKKIRKTAIRNFNRDFYTQIKDLPVAVYNRKTQKCIIVAISPEEGETKYDL